MLRTAISCTQVELYRGDDTSRANSLRRRNTLPGLLKDTLLLACASLFADISTEMLYPVLPVFLTQTLNASGSVVGLIDGVAQATQNIVQGFSGWLSDKLQKRKSIALVGYLLAAIAKPVIGLSTGWQGVARVSWIGLAPVPAPLRVMR